METYTQYYQFISIPKCNGLSTSKLSVNCTDCHALGSPLGAPVVPMTPYPEPTYQIFTFLLQDAENSCPKDLNYDRVVNGADLALLIESWGLAGQGDFSENGTIDAADLGRLLMGWGACPDQGAAPMAPPRKFDLDRPERDGFRRLARNVAIEVPNGGQRGPGRHRP